MPYRNGRQQPTIHFPMSPGWLCESPGSGQSTPRQTRLNSRSQADQHARLPYPAFSRLCLRHVVSRLCTPDELCLASSQPRAPPTIPFRYPGADNQTVQPDNTCSLSCAIAGNPPQWPAPRLACPRRPADRCWRSLQVWPPPSSSCCSGSRNGVNSRRAGDRTTTRPVGRPSRNAHL